MIKAVIFDCFGVLTEDKWHAFRITLPPGQNEQAMELMHQLSGGFITEEKFVGQVSELTGHDTAYIQRLITNDRDKNTNLLDYIAKSLKPKYKIGLLSNIASNWIRDDFLTPAEQALFDDMIFSFEVHLTKPDPQIFHLTAQRLGVEPEECVFIDDIDRYCAGATEVGMKTIVYKNLAQMQNDLVDLLTIFTLPRARGEQPDPGRPGPAR